ncbi:MAG: hypothetical protein LUD53_00355, partial [Clostridiales bacterium]|nr:hypothetical protein [Clostridiales bacterium]
MIVCYILLERTKYGRYLYAMGGNKTAAKLSGINVKRMRFLAGMFAAGFWCASRQVDNKKIKKFFL